MMYDIIENSRQERALANRRWLLRSWFVFLMMYYAWYIWSLVMIYGLR